MKAGDEVPFDKYGSVRIIVIAEGYAMVRRYGLFPFVIRVKELQKRAKQNQKPEEV